MAFRVPPRSVFRSITGGAHCHGSLAQLLISFFSSTSRKCRFSSMAGEHRRSIGIAIVLVLLLLKATKIGSIASHKAFGREPASYTDLSGKRLRTRFSRPTIATILFSSTQSPHFDPVA